MTLHSWWIEYVEQAAEARTANDPMALLRLQRGDDCVVPQQHDIQSCETQPGNAGGGKAVRLARGSDGPSSTLSGGSTVLDRLDRITEIALRCGVTR